jgi:hypothetical protein
MNNEYEDTTAWMVGNCFLLTPEEYQRLQIDQDFRRICALEVINIIKRRDERNRWYRKLFS